MWRLQLADTLTCAALPSLPLHLWRRPTDQPALGSAPLAALAAALTCPALPSPALPCPPSHLQVRVGQPAKVRPELRGACLEALVERSAPGQRAAKLRAGADTLMHQVRALQQRLAAAEGAVQAAAAAAKGTQAAAQRPGQQAAHRPAGQQLQQQTAQQQAAQQQLRQYRDLGDQVRALQRQADSLWKSAEQAVADEALTTLRRAPVSKRKGGGGGECGGGGVCLAATDSEPAACPSPRVPL